MNTNKLLLQNGYNSQTCNNFGEIARFAAQAGKKQKNEGLVLQAVKSRFGIPQTITLKDTPAPITIYGNVGFNADIEPSAIEQLKLAARLPVAVQAAAMPDSHQGYALNIGGVVALDNAVSPSFVGYDIACRMTLTVFAEGDQTHLRQEFAQALIGATHFGKGAAQFGDGRKRDHAVMSDPLWEQLSHLRQLKPLAQSQLGSSGGGNHFADLMLIEIMDQVDWLPLPVGVYTGLLTHSGSRGVGHKLATHYQRIAAKETEAIAVGIPKGYEWLSLDTEAGQEYWTCMQLMGHYAQANHQLIHDNFLRNIGATALHRQENHHNFAWKEKVGIVHRKGATPAGANVPGLIPGSSGSYSYITNGKGCRDSLNSSSHGAGRPMSRTAAKSSYDETAMQQRRKALDVDWYGVSSDETPHAYKDITRVMALQADLVDIVGTMKPFVVVMGGNSDDGD